jgi:hypothetical protein
MKRFGVYGLNSWQVPVLGCCGCGKEVGFEILTAVTYVSWDVMPCSWEEV